MFRYAVLIVLLPMYLFGCESAENNNKKNIVILTGPKSHPATMHEYIKSARLLKVMLENAGNITNPHVEIVYGGWPENEGLLSQADLIIAISDGQDGPNGLGVPFMRDDHIKIIEKEINRGCGLMTFHYSSFAPDKYGDQMLDWVGGYFDWQNEVGDRMWYSDIKFLEVEVELPEDHPIINGVKPFTIYEEYYFNIRFNSELNKLTPIINIRELESDREMGGVVAWSLEREDGGRGFGTTLGHLYANWKNDDYRKLLLNAIMFTAGNDIPNEGVESEFYSDKEVTKMLFDKDYKALILTGNNHPLHLWKLTSPVIKEAVEKSQNIHVDISEDINDLSQYDLRDYSILIFNYANWEDPNPLWPSSKDALVNFVNRGGGLMFIHFANGAFHFSMPGAAESDWPEYRNLCRRVWDHEGGSTHDNYGALKVNIVDDDHEITRGLESFVIQDELYYNQKGDLPIRVLLSAKSVKTQQEEPQAWIYEIQLPGGKESRVFQTVLGHDTTSLKTPELQEILSRASSWLVKGSVRWNDL